MALGLSAILLAACAGAVGADIGNFVAQVVQHDGQQHEQMKMEGGDGDTWAVAVLTPSPGYSGDLRTSGYMYITGRQGTGPSLVASIMFYLYGADPGCDKGQSRLRVRGACSVSVRAGASCDKIGTAHLLADGTSWPDLTYASEDGYARGEGMVSASYTVQDFDDGRTVVVVSDAAGAPVACAPIGLMTSMNTNITSRSAAVSLSFMQMIFGGQNGQLVTIQVFDGGDKNCMSAHSTGIAYACGVGVHEGRSCLDATTVGGRLFDRAAFSDGTDPWALVRYVPIDVFSVDFTSLTSMAQIAFVPTGLDLSEFSGRASVLRTATGAPLACSLLA